MGRIGGKPLPLPELLNVELAAGRQGVVLSAHAHHRSPGQLPVDGPLGGGLLKGEHHLYIPVLQQIFQGVKGHQAQHRHQLRKLLPQLSQHRPQQPQLQKTAAADPKAKDGGVLALLQPGLGHAGQGQDLPGVLGEQMPRLGKAHPLAGAVKQLDPQLVLQGVDLVAHRRLGDAQLLRRPGEVQEIGYSHKTLQLCSIQTKTLLPPPRPFV